MSVGESRSPGSRQGHELGLALRPARVLLPADTVGTGCRSASRGPPDHNQDMSWVSRRDWLVFCCLLVPGVGRRVVVPRITTGT
jgi:hypothetical protein